MAGIYDGQQAASNDETLAAIASGQGHVYYGLAAGFVVVLYLMAGGHHWLSLVALLVIFVGVAVDLYSNGFTH